MRTFSTLVFFFGLFGVTRNLRGQQLTLIKCSDADDCDRILFGHLELSLDNVFFSFRLPLHWLFIRYLIAGAKFALGPPTVSPSSGKIFNYAPQTRVLMHPRE